MMFADKLLQAVNLFPTGISQPSGAFSAQVVNDISYTATSVQGVFTESGWYRVKIGAWDGSGADVYGHGGRIMHVFYAYSGTKYLLWGCYGSSTGYPVPTGNGGYYYNPTTQSLEGEDGILGGGGGSGSNKTTSSGGQTIISHGGPGGGSATGNGAVNTGDSNNVSGAGCGFICGVDEIGTTLTTQTESFVDPNYAGFSVDSVTTMVLAGGGGSAGVAGGGGGGAYGNGGYGKKWTGGVIGPVSVQSVDGGTGPGSTTFGMGGEATVASGGVAGAGGDGAWCVRDYSTNTFTSGTGQNSPISMGTCRLEKLIY